MRRPHAGTGYPPPPPPPPPSSRDAAGATWSKSHHGSHSSNGGGPSASSAPSSIGSYHADDPEDLAGQSLLPPSPGPSMDGTRSCSYARAGTSTSSGGSANGGGGRVQYYRLQRGNTDGNINDPIIGPRRRGGGAGSNVKKQRNDDEVYAKARELWLDNEVQSRQGSGFIQRYSVPLAVLAWYLLGVTSIATTKILLTDPTSTARHGPMRFVGGVSPLVLTVQQFCIGVIMLGTIRRYQRSNAVAAPAAVRNGLTIANGGAGYDIVSDDVFSSPSVSKDLFLAGVFFSLGFLTTNMSFRRGDAAFVETVKAAEPLSSALTAVLWGIETLGRRELASLGVIVAGVTISTIGHAAGGKSKGRSGTASAQLPSTSAAVWEAAQTCIIVLVSNFCFSFRGLHQKLFRATPQGGKDVVSDALLQLKMQQIGLFAFAVPALLLYSSGVTSGIWDISTEVGLIQSGVLLRYVGLSVLNGVAFTGYNLASTYVLTRISVVHHAALNCIRRLFAIVFTSIAFKVPITVLSGFGIVISLLGFGTFTRYKLKKQRRKLNARRATRKRHESSV
mmetsp:Transcript_38411/g.78383  ORF Transcript_38411/g.78383 Transcript_38411/m.78383 type:complete len:561 (-) Transcript_38411:1495-3177(-)